MNNLQRIKKDFFARDTKQVAKALLGKYLVRKTTNGKMVAKITETEAYVGPDDKACHAYGNKKTEKTKIMFMPPGTLYVYYIYGIYFCLNVITEETGKPCAVFIREGYPLNGIELMKENRDVKIGKNYKNLIDGPSKLCMAFQITKDLFNGKDACTSDAALYFCEGSKRKEEEKEISAHKRVGIDYAEEDKDRLLRFTLDQD
ncbi:MAG: DNA-3-methyladenine glycosylase [Promethearchaeia archaeon]